MGEGDFNLAVIFLGMNYFRGICSEDFPNLLAFGVRPLDKSIPDSSNPYRQL